MQEQKQCCERVDWQYCEVKSARAPNDLTCQQLEAKFRGESWTTAQSLRSQPEFHPEWSSMAG